MIRKLIKYLAPLVLAGAAWAQGGAWSGVVQYPSGAYVPYANVQVCNYPASGNPCSNKATLYTDASLGTPISNPIVLNPTNFGQFSFGAAMGNYVVQVSGTGLNSYAYPITFGIPSGSAISALTITDLTLTNSLIFGNITLQNFGSVLRWTDSVGDSSQDFKGVNGPLTSILRIGGIVSNGHQGDTELVNESPGPIDAGAVHSMVCVACGNVVISRINWNAPQLAFEISADGTSHIWVTTFANLPTPSSSHMAYCADCTNNAGGHAAGAACANGGTGALAVVENGSWRCF